MRTKKNPLQSKAELVQNHKTYLISQMSFSWVEKDDCQEGADEQNLKIIISQSVEGS
jgi:hypothetical protein